MTLPFDLRCPDTRNILSFSGGKDSTAMYLLALELGIEFTPVCCDTGNEHPFTLEYVRDFHRKTGGPEIKILRADFTKEIEAKRKFIAQDRRVAKKQVKIRDADGRILKTIEKRVRYTNRQKRRILDLLHPTGNPFLDLCLWKGRFPSRRAQFCTEELKRNVVIEQAILPFIDDGKIVVSWQGVRADESENRAKLPEYDSPGGGLWNYRPILAWKIEDVLAIAKRHGVELNPLYKMGFNRVGCMPCINCRKSEVREMALRFPEEVRRIEEWEGLVSALAKRKGATFFAVGKTGKDEISNIRDVVEWSKTGFGGKQYDLFHVAEAQNPDPIACRSAYGLCE